MIKTEQIFLHRKKNVQVNYVQILILVINAESALDFKSLVSYSQDITLP